MFLKKNFKDYSKFKDKSMCSRHLVVLHRTAFSGRSSVVTVVQSDPEVDVINMSKRHDEGRSGAELLIIRAIHINRAYHFIPLDERKMMLALIGLEKIISTACKQKHFTKTKANQ